MGIPSYKLDILKMSMLLTKKANLAWLMFEKEKMVNDIFRLVQINNNQKNYNAFPHVPGTALNRKIAKDDILKRIQQINKPLRYQVR